MVQLHRGRFRGFREYNPLQVDAYNIDVVSRYILSHLEHLFYTLIYVYLLKFRMFMCLLIVG